MADRYWVGGTGNWSDDAHWSEFSNGPGGDSVPTSADNVFFDIGSHTSSYTVTINATASCANMTWTNPLSGSPTLTGTSALNIYGSLSFVSGMGRTFIGALNFSSTATGKTLSFNTVTTASTTTFNGVGGGWTVQNAWNNGSSNITLSNGTLNTNGQSITTAGNFLISGSSTRTLTLGASTITCAQWSATTITNLTFNANTSTITQTNTAANAFSGGGLTYNNVEITHSIGGGDCFINQSNIFNNLTIIGAAGATSTGGIGVNANQTINGTFTCNGTAANDHYKIYSAVRGTIRTLTANAVSISNSTFQDITGAGAATWSGSSLANGGNNSGITFTAVVTRYWVGGTGSWSDSSKWSTGSGGGGGASVPLVHDIAVFDSQSFTAGGQTITIDRNVGKIDMSEVLFSPTLAGSGARHFFGQIILSASMSSTLSSASTHRGVGYFALDFAGTTLTSGNFTIFHPLLGLVLWSSFSVGGALSLVAGEFDADTHNVTIGVSSSIGSSARILSLGTKTWTITGLGTFWELAGTNLTFNANTSTINATDNSSNNKTFAGGSNTYYNFYNNTAGTGNITVTGANTFNELRIRFGRTVRFTAGTTTTIKNFTALGSSGNTITLTSATSASHTLAKSTSGIVSCDFVNVSWSTATPALTWFAGANSTNSGNNSGWQFYAGPDFSREAKVSLPANDANLVTLYSGQERDNVAFDDDIFVDMTGIGFILHQFKNINTNNTDTITPTWRGKAGVAPSSKTVFLQIYKQNGATWETLASNNSAAANTEFTLTGVQSASVADYYAANNIVSFRVYQQA